MNFGKTEIELSVGQMGTKPKHTQTTIVNSEKNFYELLTCPGTEVTSHIPER